MAVLVFCEDDPTIVKLIRAAMRPTAHAIHIAGDGAEGLALVRQLRPDAVFTDVAMPHMDGFQLIAALRGDPRVAHIPVVIVSASTQQAERDEAVRRGAVEFLPKPFGPAELRRVVDETLARAATDAARERTR